MGRSFGRSLVSSTLVVANSGRTDGLGSATVSFGITYVGQPTVVVTSSENVKVFVEGISKTGFTVKTSAPSSQYSYVAVGEGSQ